MSARIFRDGIAKDDLEGHQISKNEHLWQFHHKNFCKPNAFPDFQTTKPKHTRLGQ